MTVSDYFSMIPSGLFELSFVREVFLSWLNEIDFLSPLLYSVKLDYDPFCVCYELPF